MACALALAFPFALAFLAWGFPLALALATGRTGLSDIGEEHRASKHRFAPFFPCRKVGQVIA